MNVVPPIRPIAENRVVAHLRQYGAVTDKKPMGYAPSRLTHARALRRLREAGVVKGVDGALYLDEAAWDARRGKRRRRAIAMLAVAGAGAALAALTTLRS